MRKDYLLFKMLAMREKDRVGKREKKKKKTEGRGEKEEQAVERIEAGN